MCNNFGQNCMGTICVAVNCLDKCLDKVRDQGSILKTKTVKILSQDCLETRQCLETSHHWVLIYCSEYWVTSERAFFTVSTLSVCEMLSLFSSPVEVQQHYLLNLIWIWFQNLSKCWVTNCPAKCNCHARCAWTGTWALMLSTGTGTWRQSAGYIGPVSREVTKVQNRVQPKIVRKQCSY